MYIPVRPSHTTPLVEYYCHSPLSLVAYTYSLLLHTRHIHRTCCCLLLLPYNQVTASSYQHIGFRRLRIRRSYLSSASLQLSLHNLMLQLLLAYSLSYLLHIRHIYPVSQYPLSDYYSQRYTLIPLGSGYSYLRAGHRIPLRLLHKLILRLGSYRCN